MVCMMLLASCSHDVVDEPAETHQALLTPLGFGGLVPQDGKAARAEFYVGDREYKPYAELYPLPINEDYTTIGAFMAQDAGAGAKPSYSSLSGYFRYKDNNQWETTVGVKQESYSIFGYMPSNAGASVSISKTGSSWNEGCVMHFHDLNTVTPADVCVVVGVLKAKVTHTDPSDPNSPIVPLTSIDGDPVDPADNHLAQGVYAYTGTETDNYVYLLLDHLYTNVNLELSVEEKYSKLRTIVLKQIKMKAKNITNLIDIDVTLTNDPKNPIASIAFPPDFTSADNVDAQIFPRTEENGIIVSAEPNAPTSVPGYFAPGMTTQAFDFEFLYDVYDKQGEDLSDSENPIFGNKVRENCIAINRWSLMGQTVEQGKSFNVTAIIKPTYLYQLSEPDLDNPTIELKVTPQP